MKWTFAALVIGSFLRRFGDNKLKISRHHFQEERTEPFLCYHSSTLPTRTDVQADFMGVAIFEYSFESKI
jgi:hypothetical protein